MHNLAYEVFLGELNKTKYVLENDYENKYWCNNQSIELLAQTK